MSKRTVPGVTGTTVRAAAAAITAAGLKPCLGGGNSCTPITSTNGNDVVTRQNPAAGGEADEDSNVNIYVNPIP